MAENHMAAKIVLAIEGIDGSGKSSLVESLARLCAKHGQRFTQVGRRDGNISPAIARLTQFLVEETRHLTPQGDVFLRIAREYERAQQAALTQSGLVVLDRFVLSVLALARVNGPDVRLVEPPLREIAEHAGLFATMFVQCPFEVARRRVQERRPQTWKKKERTERILQRMADCMREDFRRGHLTGQQWLVDNSASFAAAEEQAAGYLLPFLNGAHKPTASGGCKPPNGAALSGG
jgi:thymidylate kinase